MWWLSGIFRGVTLLARPGGRARGRVRARGLRPRARARARCASTRTRPRACSCPSSGSTSPPRETVTVPRVEPWSAEVPRLYDAEVVSAGERVRLRIGFRTVVVEDGLLKVNGRRVLLRGVNRHEFDPDHGRVVSRGAHARDVLLMKAHNVNAVRTSHYPPDPRFLDLCDELGLYVIDECDLESHGFFALGWRGNPSDDPALGGRAGRPHAAHGRARQEPPEHHHVVAGQRERHRAQPRRDGGLGRARDPSRPLHYEDDWSCRDVDVYSRMYATARGGRRDRPRRGGAAGRPGARRAPPRAAVHPVRVRPRHGQRPRRAARVPGAVRDVPALPGRLRVGVDRPRPAPAHAGRRRALRVRRRLRRAPARRQLRRRRPAFPRPHPVARAARVQEGDRAGADRGRRAGACGWPTCTTSATSPTCGSRGRWRRRARRWPRASSTWARVPAGETRRARAARPARDAGRDVAHRARAARGGRAVGARGPRGRVGPGPGDAARARAAGDRRGERPRAGGRRAGATTGCSRSGPGASTRRRACCAASATSRSTGRGSTSGARPRTTTPASRPRQARGRLAPARPAPRAPPRRRRRARARRARGPDPGRLRGVGRRAGHHVHLGRGRRRAPAHRRRPARGRVDVPAAAPRAAPRAARRARPRGVVRARPRRGLSATRGGPRGSGASAPRSTSCRRPTSARRRTATARRCAGPRSPAPTAPACAWRAARTSSSPRAAGRPSTSTPPPTRPTSRRRTGSGSTSTTRSTASGPPHADPACSRSITSSPSRSDFALRVSAVTA